MSDDGGLPPGWVTARLSDVAQINPTRVFPGLEPGTPVSFVPMASVKEEFGGMDLNGTRSWEAVHKGYTQFRDGDVLVAKITPCMENGKGAIVRDLTNGWGYGSTEFHVLRPSQAVRAEWIASYLSRTAVRRQARSSMTGTAGQLRVPARWLEQEVIPLPPLEEQQRIGQKIEELFSEIDAATAALERVRAKLKRYRAAVLKAAVEGKLTERWRAEHPDAEPADVLLQRILEERRRKWEEAELAKFAKAGKTPPKGWQAKYKEPEGPDASPLPTLPSGWLWVRMEQVMVESACNGVSPKGSDSPPGIRALRLSAMSDSGFDYSDCKYIQVDEASKRRLAVREGDFFVARGNGSIHLVGRGTLAQAPPNLTIFPDTMIRLRLPEAGALLQFVNLVWPSRAVRAQIERKARTTAGIYKISQTDIAEFVIPLPPTEEQEQIVAEAEARLSVAAQVEAQVEAGLKRAAQLRQSILKRAFEGKLVDRGITVGQSVELVGHATGGLREGSRTRAEPEPRKPGRALEMEIVQARLSLPEA